MRRQTRLRLWGFFCFAAGLGTVWLVFWIPDALGVELLGVWWGFPYFVTPVLGVFGLVAAGAYCMGRASLEDTDV